MYTLRTDLTEMGLPKEHEAQSRLKGVRVMVHGRQMYARVSVPVKPQSPQTLCLCMGWACQAAIWCPELLCLAPYCSVYAPDLPGVGKSAHPSVVLTYPIWLMHWTLGCGGGWIGERHLCRQLD